MITENDLIPLHIPVPPMLEESLGYPGGLLRPGEVPGRYVAFYWTVGCDEGAFHDGRISKVKINNNAYLAFVRHHVVAPHLRPYNLGACDNEADHWLVLDRKQRKLYVAPAEVAYPFLIQQWGPPKQEQPLEITSLDELMQLVASARDLSIWTETTSMIGHEQVAYDTLIAWLDNLN